MHNECDVDEYIFTCPECPQDKIFKELWGKHLNWQEHVMTEHGYTEDMINKFFSAWEVSIYDALQEEWTSSREAAMADMEYECWKDRNLCD
jgi:hypothetical protein